jgi:glucose-6-phosphate isomerase
MALDAHEAPNGLTALLQRRAPGPAPLLRETASQVDPLAACGITLDLSRQRLTTVDLDALRSLATERDVIGAERAAMRGEGVNRTEGRAALHTALRSPPGGGLGASPAVEQAVHAELVRLRAFATAVRSGASKGATGRTIADVVNIGIGGSDNGPRLLCDALAELADGPRAHFLSNVDAHAIARLLPRLDPATTLVLVSSKSFSTRETLLNAESMRAWFATARIEGVDLASHMCVVSAKPDAAAALGLPAANQFHLWDWVGGRFSMWSAIGLPAMLAIGPQRFDELLAGAHAMDRHSIEAPLATNLPATLALLALWNSAVLQASSFCVVPYDDRLRAMVPWLQQLEMESLGKSRIEGGGLSPVPTAQTVWGGVGTDAQHTFFQALRQGTSRTAIDIIVIARPDHTYPDHHRALVANARAQAEALVAPDPDSLSMNAVTLIELEAVTPRSLGSLLALYEHKTTMLATLLGINAYDQPGVELAKALARELEQR